MIPRSPISHPSTLPRGNRGAAGRATRIAVAALAVLAFSAAAPRVAAETDRERTEKALAVVWSDLSADHAKVRAGGFEASVRDAAPKIRLVLLEAASQPGAVLDEGAIRAAVRRAKGGTALDLSAASVARALARRVPAEPKQWLALGWDDAATADVVIAELRAIFSEEKLAACWDRSFLDLPEVRAWRQANGLAPSMPTPTQPTPVPPQPAPPGPTPAPTSTPPGPGPGPAQPSPPAQPTASDPPKEEPATIAQNDLVLVDRARSYVGPWTGWSQDIKDNKRKRSSNAKSVWIMRHEVTCEEYARWVASLPRLQRKDALPGGWSLSVEGEVSYPAGRGRTPVTQVSLEQAWSYAAALGMRLPTEDEWERAAAGGEKDPRPWPWGADEAKSWSHRVDSEASATPPVTGASAVDAHPDDLTPDGVAGLAGNVSEMTATTPDRKDLGSKLPKTDAQFEVVIRGGNWKSRAADCATSYRWVVSAAQGAEHVGFRCVMDDAEYRKRFR